MSLSNDNIFNLTQYMEFFFRNNAPTGDTVAEHSHYHQGLLRYINEVISANEATISCQSPQWTTPERYLQDDVYAELASITAEITSFRSLMLEPAEYNEARFILLSKLAQLIHQSSHFCVTQESQNARLKLKEFFSHLPTDYAGQQDLHPDLTMVFQDNAAWLRNNAYWIVMLFLIEARITHDTFSTIQSHYAGLAEDSRRYLASPEAQSLGVTTQAFLTNQAKRFASIADKTNTMEFILFFIMLFLSSLLAARTVSIILNPSNSAQRLFSPRVRIATLPAELEATPQPN